RADADDGRADADDGRADADDERADADDEGEFSTLVFSYKSMRLKKCKKNKIAVLLFVQKTIFVKK
ncbi:MAG: hypothetical protein ACOYN4_13540, partial [Bacteroidales bacterium]